MYVKELVYSRIEVSFNRKWEPCLKKDTESTLDIIILCGLIRRRINKKQADQ